MHKVIKECYFALIIALIEHDVLHTYNMSVSNQTTINILYCFNLTKRNRGNLTAIITLNLMFSVFAWVFIYRKKICFLTNLN